MYPLHGRWKEKVDIQILKGGIQPGTIHLWSKPATDVTLYIDTILLLLIVGLNWLVFAGFFLVEIKCLLVPDGYCTKVHLSRESCLKWVILLA